MPKRGAGFHAGRDGLTLGLEGFSALGSAVLQKLFPGLEQGFYEATKTGRLLKGR